MTNISINSFIGKRFEAFLLVDGRRYWGLSLDNRWSVLQLAAHAKLSPLRRQGPKVRCARLQPNLGPCLRRGDKLKWGAFVGRSRFGAGKLK
jgi:hypothetical protein